MARSLNKVTLIGNLTRDPEMKYTPQGTAVCTFGLATNRSWQTDSGEKKEDVEFHRIVAWNKLAEICAQLLTKGRKAYIEGRLQTRDWTGDDNVKHNVTEVVASEMILLDSKGSTESTDFDVPDDNHAPASSAAEVKKPEKKSAPKAEEPEDEEEIPF